MVAAVPISTEVRDAPVEAICLVYNGRLPARYAGAPCSGPCTLRPWSLAAVFDASDCSGCPARLLQRIAIVQVSGGGPTGDVAEICASSAAAWALWASPYRRMMHPRKLRTFSSST